MASRTSRWLAGIAVIVLACAFAIPAYAAEQDEPTAEELQLQLETTVAAYSEAREQLQSATDAVEANQQRLDELEAELPTAKERSDEAARMLYKFERDSGGALDFILSATSFRTFLTSLDYVNRVSDSAIREMARLASLKAELTATQAELDAALANAEEQEGRAQTALDIAQAAVEEAQRRAAEEEWLRAEAEAAAAALEAEIRANDEASGSGDSESASDAGDAGDGGVEGGGGSVSGDLVPAPASADEAAFIDMWAPRIDAYLAGSPLAGQGRTFASAAYTYGVDPRWSPAISNTESTKGRYCFLPHNAWGWGSASWDTWEEAIFDHVAGLSRGYGYTISVEAAKKYCPPNWEHWYNATLAQMNSI